MTATPMPPAAEPAQPKKSRTWLIILIVVLVLCCLCGAVVVAGSKLLPWLWENGDKLLGTGWLLAGMPAI
jgi:flagellar basal body-associated protein FliL